MGGLLVVGEPNSLTNEALKIETGPIPIRNLTRSSNPLSLAAQNSRVSS